MSGARQAGRIKDFAVSVRLYNNQLRERRLSLGMNQREFAEAVGLQHGVYNALETLRGSPLNRRGEWRPVAKRLAAFHGTSVEDLFPESLSIVTRTHVEKTLSAEEVIGALALAEHTSTPEELFGSLEEQQNVKRLMYERLTMREREVVLRHFFEGETLEEIGEFLGVSRERARDIECRALSKIRGAYWREDWEERENMRRWYAGEALAQYDSELLSQRESLARTWRTNR